MLYSIDKLKLHTYIYLFIYLFIINFSQKDRGHTKGEPVLGVPPYTHSYIHTYIQLQGQNTKKQLTGFAKTRHNTARTEIYFIA